MRICSKEHLLEERVASAETLAYLMEPDVELQRIASTTDHLVAMLSDYFKYPSSVSAITDIKRVGGPLRFSLTPFNFSFPLWTKFQTYLNQLYVVVLLN